MDTRINQGHLMIDVEEGSYSERDMLDYAAAENLKDLVVLKPIVTGNKSFRMYMTKKNDKPFNFNNGLRSVAKKLKVKNPNALSLVSTTRNKKMPDHFFQLLDPDQPLDNQIALTYGRFAERSLIKAHIETALKQNKNRQICNKIKSEGAIGTVESGALSVGQLKSAQAYEAELAKRAEKAERLTSLIAGSNEAL